MGKLGLKALYNHHLINNIRKSGQESTAWTTITYLAHHGINYVPFGFANTHLFDNSEVVGGSAYGAGTVGRYLGNWEHAILIN